MTKKEIKARDKEIDRIFKEACNGVQIPIMELGSVFEAARTAHAKGEDMRAAMLDRVAAVRKN